MRSSPPIHTCSEHAQGPSKPPAVVRKLWRLNARCCLCDILESLVKWQPWIEGWGEGGVGSIRWNAPVALWHYGSRIHLLKVTVTGEVLLIVPGLGPPSVGGICPLLHTRACRSQRWSAERQWNIEFCITTILVIAEWPWTPSRAQFVCISDLLVFDGWLLTFFSLACLDDFVIKMRSLDMNTECLAKSEVFRGRGEDGDLSSNPLHVPLHLNLTAWSHGTTINPTSEARVLIVVFPRP